MDEQHNPLASSGPIPPAGTTSLGYDHRGKVVALHHQISGILAEDALNELIIQKDGEDSFYIGITQLGVMDDEGGYPVEPMWGTSIKREDLEKLLARD